MKEFIEYLVKQVVNKPEEVKVTESEENGEFIFLIDVNTEDMGLVIGREGRIIRSIRNLAKSKAIKDNVRIQIRINESND